ncbi:DUF4265 domain-containing protein [Xanthomonas hyacinthi]|uniref:DUF4265 domain-containing protein n=1 Tax=Xanthomonas hyacinthi TaxID=56455 RepID=UPI00361C3021
MEFPVSEGGEHLVERMHALARGDGNFVLDNSPFYAFGISCGDVFSASPSEDGGLVFSEVVSRGGHSTYRVKLPAGRKHEDFLAHWLVLEKLGCTYEGSSANPERLYSIDVPAGADVFEIYRLLEEGEREKAWFFEEGYYFKPVSD